ncbi:sushi, von Willebrand factor type A, EGF and pentraxin domain-containing protein 1-like isoform X3 [Cheilinus undulatus]|uniref:sushi, von Willebrand factor type A, EGF and pentraxin domain-containing protein 1-like isoform X3 n=1 Tax=Cheilinus undulatus TaxID=241271 RepID=UPI001BD4B6A6|nr:sushi, von Willebrand factor type A, EGF and pentraxin domain-containing protein 1-like isoform X3 [Cheilinus undulatus]
MAVSVFVLLSSLGLVFTAQAQDCTTPTPGPHMVLRDKDIVLEEFPEGTRVGFTCEIGYEIIRGSIFSTCTAGKWSDVSLECDRKSCGSAGEVNDNRGYVDYSNGNQFGDVAVVYCNTGYRLVGNNRIRCGAQGWMDRLPVCEVVTCAPPPRIDRGTFSPEKESHYNYNDIVQYVCERGLTLSHSKPLTCSENGTFTPEAPSCENFECKPPNIANALWEAGTPQAPYKHKATVTHICKDGYKMFGEPTSECDKNEWKPKLLECKPKNCSTPVGQPNSSLKDKETYSGFFPHETRITFVCDDNFESSGGSAVSTCNLGNWSPGVTLTCKKNDNNNNGGKIAAGVLCCAAVVGGGVAAWTVYKKKKKQGNKKGDAEDNEEAVQLQSCKHSSPVAPTLLQVNTSD